MINRPAIGYLMKPKRRTNAKRPRPPRGYAGGGAVFDARYGGVVPPGRPGRDTVPALTSGGPAMLDSNPGPGRQEYVMPADSTAKIGIPTLDAWKNATHDPASVTSGASRVRNALPGIPGYQQGGPVQQEPAVGVLPKGVRRYGPTGMMLAEQEEGLPGARRITLAEKATLGPLQYAATRRAHAIAHPLEQERLAQEARSKLPARQAEALPQASQAQQSSPMQRPTARRTPARRTPGSGGRASIRGLESPAVPATEGQYIPAGTDRMALSLPGARGEAFRTNVPQQRKGEFGGVIYGGTPEEASVTAFEGSPGGGFVASMDDWYGGYDLSGMSPSERMAFKQSLAQEAADMRAASAYMALPPGQRGTFNPGSRTGESVARAMGIGPPPSQQLVAGAEQRGREQLAAQQQMAADLEMEERKQQGETRRALIEERAGVAQEQAKLPPTPDFGQVPQYVARARKAREDFQAGRISEEAMQAAELQALAALRQLERQMQAQQALADELGPLGGMNLQQIQGI